jgi:hypothetical protein
MKMYATLHPFPQKEHQLPNKCQKARARYKLDMVIHLSLLYRAVEPLKNEKTINEKTQQSIEQQ